MISKTLHQIWLGSDPLPVEYARFIQTWKDHHPDWEYKLWTDSDIAPDFVTYSFISEIDDVCITPNVYKADILRYEILHKYGGVYVDVDFECHKPIDELLFNQHLNVCGLYGNYCYTGLIMAEAGNPVLKKCIDNIDAVDFTLAPDISTGHYYFRKQFDLTQITCLPTVFFYPYHYGQKPYATDQSYATHHFSDSWRPLYTSLETKSVPLFVTEKVYSFAYGKPPSFSHGRKKHHRKTFWRWAAPFRSAFKKTRRI